MILITVISCGANSRIEIVLNNAPELGQLTNSTLIDSDGVIAVVPIQFIPYNEIGQTAPFGSLPLLSVARRQEVLGEERVRALQPSFSQDMLTTSSG
jgi:hypothetical protein